MHNDDPHDTFPERLVLEVNDRRIIYVRHTKNLGASESFSLAYRPVAEQFMSILEDDNWWEPEFLEIALQVLRANPTLTLVWANMWKWQESPGNLWAKAGTIWPTEDHDGIEPISEDHPRQVVNHLHSHGAMVLRVGPNTTFATPQTIPVAIIEPIRERAYPLPMARINRPLGNFALTLTNCHDPNLARYLQGLVLLAGSFLRHASKPSGFYLRAWQIAKSTSIYLMIAIFVSVVSQGRFKLLRKFPLRDLAFCAGWCGRHPRRLFGMLRAAHDQPELEAFLDSASQQKWCNSKQCGRWKSPEP
jgi:hypothetical protein